MPLPRFAKLPEDRQAALLTAARGEFAEHGFAAASFNRIIAATGISKGAMYYYFADKADLYTCVLENALDEIEVMARATGPLVVGTPDEFWDELSNRALQMFLAVESDAEVAALGHKLYASGVGLKQLTERVSGWIQVMLRIGQDKGAVRTDIPIDMLAHATTGLIMGLDRHFTSAFNAGSISPEEMAQSPAMAIRLCRSMLAER